MSRENKKRVNIYLDIENYERTKKILDIMGLTVTDFFNQTLVDFIDSMESIVENQDKDAFLKMMSKNIDSLQKQVADELNK